MVSNADNAPALLFSHYSLRRHELHCGGNKQHRVLAGVLRVPGRRTKRVGRNSNTRPNMPAARYLARMGPKAMVALASGVTVGALIWSTSGQPSRKPSPSVSPTPMSRVMQDPEAKPIEVQITERLQKEGE